MTASRAPGTAVTVVFGEGAGLAATLTSVVGSDPGVSSAPGVTVATAVASAVGLTADSSPSLPPSPQAIAIASKASAGRKKYGLRRMVPPMAQIVMIYRVYPSPVLPAIGAC